MRGGMPEALQLGHLCPVIPGFSFGFHGFLLTQRRKDAKAQSDGTVSRRDSSAVVAQTDSPLYRGLAIRRLRESSSPCRIPFGDTADCQSAPRPPRGVKL